jgi:hypothetical protein
MMKKTIEIQFSSQSKSVTAQTSIALEGDHGLMDPQSVLEEAKRLFNEAEKYALSMTFQRNK